MAIITRSLESVQTQGDGTVLASFLAIDSSGREWRRSRSRFADEAAATAASAAFDWIPQLEDLEGDSAAAFVRTGGDPDAFTRTDLTATQLRRRLALRFWRTRFDLDRKFLCNVADWITGFSAGQISSALGITNPQAQTILDRAAHIRDIICPAILIDDGRIGGIE